MHSLMHFGWIFCFGLLLPRVPSTVAQAASTISQSGQQQCASMSGAPLNFGAASTLDSVVYGSVRPGGQGPSTGGKTTEDAVKEWAEFMKENGVKRVVGLLADDEVETYERPPVETLKEQGMAAVNVAVDKGGPEAAKAVMAAIQEAADAGEKVVVHCWGGGGRAGKVLAAWLVQKHGLTPQDAASEVLGTAAHTGTSRRVNPDQLAALLQAAGVGPGAGSN